VLNLRAPPPPPEGDKTDCFEFLWLWDRVLYVPDMIAWLPCAAGLDIANWIGSSTDTFAPRNQ